VRVILYDLVATQPEGGSPVSGGGEYAKRVYRALVNKIPPTGGDGNERQQEEHFKLYALADADKALDPELEELSSQRGITLIRSRDVVAEVVGIIERLEVDTFFSALPLRYRWLRFPPHLHFIYTIHGLRSLELIKDRYERHFFHSRRSVLRYCITRLAPRWYQKQRRKDFQALLSCSTNRQVITVSRHTRYALLAEFPQLREEDVFTYYSPAETTQTKEDASVLQELGIADKGYILIITGNRWAKNPYRAVNALAALKSKGLLGDTQVVISGAKGVRYLAPFVREYGFIGVDYVSRAKLTALYHHAYCFIFPTLNEGFGYPPLECMANGTPVIASPINSLPELLGDAALWVDPLSEREMEGRILRLLRDKVLYAMLVEEGMTRARLVAEQQRRDLEDLVNLIIAS